MAHENIEKNLSIRGKLLLDKMGNPLNSNLRLPSFKISKDLNLNKNKRTFVPNLSQALNRKKDLHDNEILHEKSKVREFKPRNKKNRETFIPECDSIFSQERSIENKTNLKKYKDTNITNDEPLFVKSISPTKKPKFVSTISNDNLEKTHQDLNYDFLKCDLKNLELINKPLTLNSDCDSRDILYKDPVLSFIQREHIFENFKEEMTDEEDIPLDNLHLKHSNSSPDTNENINSSPIPNLYCFKIPFLNPPSNTTLKDGDTEQQPLPEEGTKSSSTSKSSTFQISKIGSLQITDQFKVLFRPNGIDSPKNSTGPNLFSGMYQMESAGSYDFLQMLIATELDKEPTTDNTEKLVSNSSTSKSIDSSNESGLNESIIGNITHLGNIVDSFAFLPTELSLTNFRR